MGASALGAPAAPRFRRRDGHEAEEEITIDLERRLAKGLRSAARAAVEAAPDAGEPAPAAPFDPGERVELVMDSPAGRRRVAVEEKPISVGSHDHCELVLAAADGVAPEHALIWRNSHSVLLHTTDPGARCIVNGRPVTWVSLEDGDTVEIGAVVLRVETVTDP